MNWSTVEIESSIFQTSVCLTALDMPEQEHTNGRVLRIDKLKSKTVCPRVSYVTSKLRCDSAPSP